MDGIIMPKLAYGITVWGLSASSSLLNKVQTVQNLGMRWILNENRFASTESLLRRTKYMSIHQLSIYYSLLQFWKILKDGVPVRLYDWIDINTESINRINQTGRVWSKIAPIYFDKLDNGLKVESKISRFKKGLKQWILCNVPINKPLF